VKSEELLTSCGVSATNPRDPLPQLLGKSNTGCNYKRSIFSEEGKVITRLECTFYSSILLTPRYYRKIICSIFPRKLVTKVKWAKQVNVADYFTTLHKGQKLFGRTIQLEDLKDDKIRMTFIRFKNNPADKYIGFILKGSKQEVFLQMLRSIINFTIPGSYTSLVYFTKK
jgi:hypothetical protein